MIFPVYRKYSNNKSFFKVFDANTFEEIQVLGSNYWVHHFEAKILPDRYFLQDLINMEGGRWLEISEETYNQFLEKCRLEYKKHD